jgi:tripeptidyl-peptidase-1
VDGYVTPELLALVYSFGLQLNDRSSTPRGLGVSQAVLTSKGQFYSPRDLETFQTNFRLPVIPIQAALGDGDHVNNDKCANLTSCYQANGEVQYMNAVATTAVAMTYFFYSDDLIAFMLKYSNMTNPPLVINIGFSVLERYLSVSVMLQFNLEAIKLSLQGVTIIVPSGDDGANANLASSSVTSSCTSSICCKYSPEFPASSPFVTAVGGTKVSLECLIHCLQLFIFLK